MDQSGIIRSPIDHNKNIQIRVRARFAPGVRAVQDYAIEFFPKQLSEFMRKNLEKFCLLFGVHEVIITPGWGRGKEEKLRGKKRND